MSQLVDGVIYVALRSLKGSAKFLWSAIEVASDQNDRRVDVEEQVNISQRLPDNRDLRVHALNKSGLATLTGNAS